MLKQLVILSVYKNPLVHRGVIILKKLNVKEIIFILIIYTVGVLYILTDQLFVPLNIRFIALVSVQVLLYVIIYTKMKSSEPLKLSVTLALILCFFVIPLYIVQDLLINKDYSLKPIIITSISLMFPLFIGLIYQILMLVKGEKS